MYVSDDDRRTHRDLATRVAEIADEPVQEQRKREMMKYPSPKGA